MVRTLWHKLFSPGQSGAQRGDRRDGVRQRRMHKPLLESLEERNLPSLFAPVVYGIGQSPEGLAVGDLRGNGRLDLVTANEGNGSVSVLLGNGDRTFQPAVRYATGGTESVSVALARLRPGGPLDVVTANSNINRVGVSDGNGTVSVLLGNGNGTFRAGVQYSVGHGEGPVAVAVGDFAGRGIADLVTLNVGVDVNPDTFSVLAGNGDGTFQPPVFHTLPPLDRCVRTNDCPASLAVGDFTGKGHLSIAVGIVGGVQVFLGNGDGTFQAPVFYPGDRNAFVTSVLLRDLAGTGRLDLVTANFRAGTVSVLRGQGDGTFGPAANYPAGDPFPLTVAAGRFRSGGPLDLVTTSMNPAGEVFSSESVNVLPGAGDGTFGPPAQYNAGTTAWAVAAADFAGRGTDDLVVTNPQLDGTGIDHGTVSVLPNRGDGTFPPFDSIHFSDPRIGAVSSLATADFRGIGVQDLVTTNWYDDTVSVFLGNGDGTFAAPQTFPAGPNPGRVVVGDFNGDGILDLAVADSDIHGRMQSVSILLGNGDGTFQAPRLFAAGGLPGSIAAGHFHDPNILDLVTTDFQDFQHFTVNVFVGNGDGTFQAPVSYPVGRTASSVAVGELRGNGITDLVVTNADDNTVGVLLGNGDGTFAPAVNYRISDDIFDAFYPRFVALGDLRGNGRLDIVTVNEGRFETTVLPSNGDGTFGDPIHLDAGTNARAVVIADFDNHGIPDLVVANDSSRTVSLLHGNGDGTFRPRVRYAVGRTSFALAVGDFNGDNLPDVAVLNSNSISVLLNDGQPSHASPGRGSFSNRSIPLASKHSPAPGRIDPGVFSLLPSGARGPSSVDTTVRDQPAAVRQSQPETAAPLPAEGTVRQATDAVFADSHRTQPAIPSAGWEVEELQLGLVSE